MSVSGVAYVIVADHFLRTQNMVCSNRSIRYDTIRGNACMACTPTANVVDSFIGSLSDSRRESTAVLTRGRTYRVFDMFTVHRAITQGYVTEVGSICK